MLFISVCHHYGVVSELTWLLHSKFIVTSEKCGVHISEHGIPKDNTLKNAYFMSLWVSLRVLCLF